MSISLLFSDVDRTLLTHDHRLLPAVVAAVERAKAAGIRIVLASARSPIALRPFAEALEAEALSICFNGAWIGNVVTGSPKAMIPLAKVDVLNAFHQARVRGAVPIAFQADAVSVLAEDLAAVRRELAVTKEPVRIIDGAHEIQGEVFKVLCVSEGQILDDLAPRLGCGVNATRSAEHLLEVVSRGVTKGEAARDVAALLEVEALNCAAIGDAYNDVSMLKFAGTRLTVANAVPEIRDLADHIASSCDEGGMAGALDWLLARELNEAVPGIRPA